MPATNAIAEALNAIIMTLDPVQRWQAARRFDGNWITHKWFIIISLVTLIILITIILITSLIRNTQRNKTKKLIAAKIAQHKGLSPHEIQTLKDITKNPKIKNKTEIFTNKKAFDDSAKKIIEKQKQQKSPEQIEKLNVEFNILREKLGFQETGHSNIDVTATKQLSTRQIPTDKTLYIKAVTSKADEIESTVIENTETGLSVKLATHPRVNFNEQWKGYYSFEDYLCEFDTSVISYDGTCLVLAHSENVQCLNRRRFRREVIEYQALIAIFPQNKSTENKNFDNKTDTNETESPQQDNSSAFSPPKFVNATVTEIGGASLKIKTDLKARENDRVLIILNLSEQKQKIIQDIAVIRRVIQTGDGNFLAAEMFGMSDEHLEELVHAADTAPTDENITPTNDNITPTDANTAPTDANTTPTGDNAAPTDANTTSTDENTAPTDENTAPTDEAHEKNDNTENTNEENKQANITQET